MKPRARINVQVLSWNSGWITTVGFNKIDCIIPFVGPTNGGPIEH